MKNANTYISRGIDKALASWKSEVTRKPLLLRGPRQVGKSTSVRHLAQSFEYFIEVLILAGLVIPVTHTSSNGIPLGAEVDPKKRKMLIFDTGVFQRLLGLNIGELMISNSFEVVNKGALAELSVGLELSKLSSHYRNDPLYYWQRESVSGNAEIDYVFQKSEMIIPIEVKSGVRGSMQSLHLFLKEKKIDKGIRFSLENFSDYQNIKTIPIYNVSIINEFGN